MSRLIVYADLNCPFCYALSERLHTLGVMEDVDWRCIEHAPDSVAGNTSFAEQSELASEVYNVRHRAPEVAIALPKARCNSHRASVLCAWSRRLERCQAVDLRMALYQALWLQGKDIESEAVCAEILERQRLGTVTDRELKNAEANLFSWQQEWECGAYDSRIPAVIRGTDTLADNALPENTDNKLLGLPSTDTLQAFLDGKQNHYRGDAVCERKTRQRVLIAGRIERFWPFLETMREQQDILLAVSARDLFEQLNTQELPDLVLLDVDESAMTALASCRKIKRTAATSNIPVILFADEVDEDEEIRAYQCNCSDYIPLTKASEVICAHIQMQLHFKRSLDQLSKSARIDGLTQVYNRREFDLTLESEWRRAERARSQMSLLIIDVDYFKYYNDKFGHLMGDDCLRLIAERIREAGQRSSDRVFRYGGEEFAIIMPDTNCEGAAMVAEELRLSIERLNISLPIKDICERVTVSVGVACLTPDEQTSPTELIEAADQALYRAKDLSRNLVFCAV